MGDTPGVILSPFTGRIGVLQRVVPGYRRAFFDHLAASCHGGLQVAAGEPRVSEAIQTASELGRATLVPLRNVHWFRGPAYLCWQRGVSAWLERWEPDVLVVEANPRLATTGVAIDWMKCRGRPVLGWGLGMMAVTAGWQQARAWVRRHAIRRFDGIVAYSTRAAREYVAAGFPEDRVFVAHNAVTPAARSPRRSLPVVPTSKLSVLFVGRLTAAKGLRRLLEACSRLTDALKPILTVVGDGPMRATYEHEARALYPGARFVGERHGELLDDIWAQADLLVLPGQGGLAIQEAMSHSLPVIVAEGDGTQEDLVRPENGWIISSAGTEPLAAALQEALSDPDRLRRMGMESYRIVQAEINIDQMCRHFLDAINTVANPAGHGES